MIFMLMIFGTVVIGMLGFKAFAFFTGAHHSGRAQVFVAVVTLALVAGQWSWYGLRHTSADREKAREQAARDYADSECKSTTGAYVMSQGFVKRTLKAPATAVFPSNAVSSTVTGKCQFVVVGFVDSHNDFGASIRKSYVAKIEYLPASKDWHLLSLTM